MHGLLTGDSVIKLQFYVIQRDLKLAHGGKINSAECGYHFTKDMVQSTHTNFTALK